ncbi:hypothetical protein MUU53_12655 [Rhizobium lemnae]|uniref:hypothetical protein n=1 Tax=Rhizobium lemnae TaxID=1214924 RepID=UPI001FF2D035|nr:hypothetical protein [Rhizobium lemnae]MCJ8508762.1 hypothetical protein [Rhizobium lemnae]
MTATLSAPAPETTAGTAGATSFGVAGFRDLGVLAASGAGTEEVDDVSTGAFVSPVAETTGGLAVPEEDIADGVDAAAAAPTDDGCDVTTVGGA